MMKRMMFALVAMAVTAVSAFAAEVPAPGPKGGDHAQMMPPAAMEQMGRNPQHLLAMGYHSNLVNFARALEKVARQGGTVPVDFARAAVTEMRRSLAQMEIYQSEAIKTMPAELKAKQGEMTRMMDAHVSEMRGHLARLEELAKGDRIDSGELLKRLQPLFKGGKGMQHGHMDGDCGDCAKMHGGGCAKMQGGGCAKMHGGMHHQDMERECEHCRKMDCEEMGEGCEHCMKMHGGGHGEGMHGEGMHGNGHHAGMERWHGMMEQRQKMMAEMKAQDAELARLVEQMNQAPQDRKQDVMAEILTRMVQQRATIYRHLEKMQRQMGHGDGEMGEMGHDVEDADSDDNDDSDDSE